MTKPAQEKRELTKADRQLLAACLGRDMAQMREALANGADFRAEADYAKPSSGKTALHYAVLNGFMEGVVLLRSLGMSINEPETRQGDSPLHLLTPQYNTEGFALLLEMGADAGQVNAHGHSARQAAMSCDAKTGGKRFSTVLEHYDNLPYREKLDGLTTQELFARREDGYCLLDNPAMRLRMGEIGEALAASGSALTLEALQDMAADGRSYLEKMMMCDRMPATVAALNRSGQKIGAAELLEEDGSLSATGQKIVEWRQLDAVFTRGNLRGMHSGDMLHLLNRFPPEAREQVSNVHQLQHVLHQEQLTTRER